MPTRVNCLPRPHQPYNDTSAQPQTDTMGAADRDPAGGEIPMMQSNPLQFMTL